MALPVAPPVLPMLAKRFATGLTLVAVFLAVIGLDDTAEAPEKPAEANVVLGKATLDVMTGAAAVATAVTRAEQNPNTKWFVFGLVSTFALLSSAAPTLAQTKTPEAPVINGGAKRRFDEVGRVRFAAQIAACGRIGQDQG